MKRLSNIEIYVEGCSIDVLVRWIEKAIGKLERAPDVGKEAIYDSKIGSVIISPSAGSFTSVWFNTDETPWATDVDCGRQAVRDLNCIVRCDPGLHFPEVDPLSDTFLQISADGERFVGVDW